MNPPQGGITMFPPFYFKKLSQKHFISCFSFFIVINNMICYLEINMDKLILSLKKEQLQCRE